MGKIWEIIWKIFLGWEIKDTAPASIPSSLPNDMDRYDTTYIGLGEKLFTNKNLKLYNLTI